MKNIEDYYWMAKDENEKAVLISLLKIKNTIHAGITRNLYDIEFPVIRVCGGVIDCEPNNMALSNRTESTLEQLLEWALKGFDLREPWEIPPEGYRLVTDEERKKYDKPNDCLKFCKSAYDRDWCQPVQNGEFEINVSYAVPVSYEFEPQRVKVVCEGKETWISKEDAQTLNLCD
jgi:hypothetical protein